MKKQKTDTSETGSNLNSIKRLPQRARQAQYFLFFVLSFISYSTLSEILPFTPQISYSWCYGAYINMQVTSPSGHEIRKFDAASEGRVDFMASEDGERSFCFRNAQTETEISFWVNTETDSALTDVAREEHVNDMVHNIEKFNSLVRAARIDHEAFKAQEHFHRKISDKNRRRVTFWAIVECILIFGVTGVQIMRIRNFFELKRMV